MRIRIACPALIVALAMIASACLPTAGEAELVRDNGSLTLRETTVERGFARALSPQAFSFPEDHGPHFAYQSEWWYYTGNLKTETGQRFGYQFTIFRRGLTAAAPERDSDLAANQIYFAHFAILNAETERHHFSDRYSRGAAGLAGATHNPLQIWIEDWSIEGLDETGSEVRLRAADGGMSLDLTLAAVKPIVAHGEDGLSPKSEQPGNASYYLSFPRMRTEGAISFGGENFTVAGESWFDHEWSTSALGEDAVGWDWFGLQLDNGQELMLFTIRRQDGSLDPVSGGTLIFPDGTTRRITRSDFSLEALGSWRSPESDVEYPSGWKIRIPSEALELTVDPVFEGQEMRVGFIYWEGAVDVQGEMAGRPVSGRGYAELTGYAESMLGVF